MSDLSAPLAAPPHAMAQAAASRSAASTVAADIDWRDIPVFIVNRNRCEALQRLVAWLLTGGTRRVVILDNASSYAPLLDYYAALPEGAKLMRLDKNFGPYVFWQQGVHKVIDTPYVVTDSDVVPADCCPADLIARLLAVLQRYPDVTKAGPALRIDNLPDAYIEADTVRKWESQYWEHPVAPGLFAAPIDTTFALYPPHAEFSNDTRSLRLGHPFIAEHTPWYAEEHALSEEERYYRQHTSATFSNWSVENKDSWVRNSPRVAHFEERAKVLHLNGGGEYIPGWINAGVGPALYDSRYDARSARDERFDLPDNSVDGIHLSHVLENVSDVRHLFEEIYRVARPNATMFVRVDYGVPIDCRQSSDRCCSWTEDSFAHLSQPMQTQGSEYEADWQTEGVLLIAADPAESSSAGVPDDGVREMVVTLRAVKPRRAKLGLHPESQVAPRIQAETRVDPAFIPVSRPALQTLSEEPTSNPTDAMSNLPAPLAITRETIRRFSQLATPVAPAVAGVLEQAKEAYVRTMQTYRSMGISPVDYLGPIWSHNIDQHLIPNIRDCKTIEQAIGYLNDKAFYDFSCGEPYLTPSIEWRMDFLQMRHGCDVTSLPANICESPLVLRKHCKSVGGRLLSSDFMNRLAWLFRLQKAIDFPQGAFSILEVGGGFGALARVFKLAHSRVQVVLVDIPESLFFQHAFLKASFPEARHQYLERADEVITDADFVYVPNCFADSVKGKEFFLAVNTNSFGEMREKDSAAWIDLIQSQTATANIFLLNRFMNRIDKDLIQHRKGHSNWSFLLDDRWSMREWEVDPDYERCPYFQTTLTRNVHIIASRRTAPSNETAELLQRAQRIALEDWFLRPGWSNYQFVTGAKYPPLMSRGDHNLTPDLGRTGTLYVLWSLVRLTGQRQWVGKLISYLDYLNGQQTDQFYEELPTLIEKLGGFKSELQHPYQWTAEAG